jgi:serine protease AprX
MAIEIPRGLIEDILFGSGDSRRYIQDSPILLDVWVKYAQRPGDPADLLITSHNESTATELAAEIYKGITRPANAEEDAAVSPLHSFVAARLYFGEVLANLVPLTEWWQDEKTQAEFDEYDSADSAKLAQTVADVIELRKKWLESPDTAAMADTTSPFERFVALCTLVCVAGSEKLLGEGRSSLEAVDRIMQLSPADDIVPAVLGFLQTMQPKPKPKVWQISLNRPAKAAIALSVPTVKADAARRLFDIDCAGIYWAVLDTGVDAQHPAFGDRVKATYDFTACRHIVSVGNERASVRAMNLKRLEEARGEKLPRTANAMLKEIGETLFAGRPVPWDLVGELVRLDKPPQPVSKHGTHVAGIIGAAKYDTDSEDGMCPAIGIYDLRVLRSDTPDRSEVDDTEFAIVAALQFIRTFNEQAGSLMIKGANMSLQIAHDVRSAACGRTPICKESERLIDSGVVVVAAAGNHGYNETIVDGQPVNDYVAYGIADPGNTERVITVGSTHRDAPFAHGVSFFSSRGPTGDGRLKPDLVAPGQQITAPMPAGTWGRLDGTSQAAPHVSGAAAMLMARYAELIGNPDRIKRILCETATDLGRERNFQGHGLLDVLRALQSQ